MKSKYFLFFLIIAGFLPECISGQNYSRIQIGDNILNISKLVQIDLPLDELIRKDNHLILELSEYEIRQLDSIQVLYEVIVPNLSRYYVERNQNADPAKVSRNTLLSDDYPVPSGFSLGSMGGYFKYDEMMTHLNQLAQLYPDLVKPLDTIEGGVTHQGRHLYWLKLSDNPMADEDEPEILFTGTIHAREPVTISLLIFFMYYLLENYDSDPEIQYLLDHHELYFIPCINPDGYIYNETNNPLGGGMWRKNMRNNGNGYFGVDLNRNFGYMWGYDNNGSSPTPGSETYRGPSAFSEPETKLVRNFCNQHQFRFCMNYHAHGNLLLYPWGYLNISSPDELVLKSNAQSMAALNSYSTGRPAQLLYTTNGDANDWMYGEQTAKPKILAYVSEVGSSEDGFWPAINRIIPLCQENVFPNLMAVKLAGTYAKLIYTQNLSVNTPNFNFTFSITRMGATPANYSVWIEPITSNISSVGSYVNYNGMNLPETRQGIISVQLNNCMIQGEEIRFRLCRSDGIYTWKEEVVYFYGQKLEIFNDPANNLSNWTPGFWGTTNQKYVSSPTSITDSPGGNYQNSQINHISLTNYIDLTQCVAADVSFNAQWKLEPAWDFVQIKVSIDGNNWIPLKGNFTKNGSESQAPGEPVYDGNQTSWVNENIDITDYCGNHVKFRFTLQSDASVAYDGFYFDDFKINAVNAQNVEQILIPEGWSGISGYLVPPDTNLDEVLNSIQSQLVLLENFEGIYWPSNGINTLQNWINGKGYMIKSNQSVQLDITGIPDNNRTLEFNQGWNLVSVICPCGISADLFYEQTLNHALILAEVAGNKIYWPEMNISTLQFLSPGKSYFGFFDEDILIENVTCE